MSYNYKIVISSMLQPSVTDLKQNRIGILWTRIKKEEEEKKNLPYALQAEQYHSLKCNYQYYLRDDIYQGGKEIIVIMRMESGIEMESSIVVA